ncbi:response regulator [Noviherbaspirillum sp.]|jgi:twitching motility two-component system response regulator PilG|uniref:response regulator n=1 Tax=Noviherbaspirillum sp. TaxID=1926288 RepID=UPI0025F7C26E|nr:response regulator [Noviherbaspirillum sp.]
MATNLFTAHGDEPFHRPLPIMNLALQSEAVQTGTRRFVLEMLGFSAAEKTMLSSTFRLTGRRSCCYAEPSAPNERADIYLVNADNPDAVRLLQQRSPSTLAPAVLIGRVASEGAWPVVEKPIHWMRLFEQLDRQMQEALQRRAQRDEEGQWDGRTFRRATDKIVVPPPVFLETHPMESVLVVDDSATVRAFMRTRLAPFRFDVDYAENGEMAIDMAQAKRYTCIFLDILMPGMDGYQVCKRIKASPATKEAAVVMLSSKSSAFDKFRGTWAGCDAYLGKPVGEDELLATIARFLPSARRVAQSILTRTS